MKKGEKRPDLQRARIGTCPICGKEFRAVKDYKERKQIYCSDECRKKRARIVNECKWCGKEVITFESINKQFCNMECRNAYYANYNKGENSPAWKGGKTSEMERIKGCKKYHEWRTSVFRRDGYTCRGCGIRGGHLEAHHILPKSEFPELMFDLDNGITLCHECHKKTDSYGAKARGRKAVLLNGERAEPSPR